MKSTGNSARNGKASTLILCGIAALAVQVPLASAADYGVGVFHSGDGSTVLVPIRLQSLTVEPELTVFRTSSDTQTSRYVNLATGIYVRRELGPLFESYAGGRIGYLIAKNRSNTGTGAQDTDTHSLTLIPTFGIQHFFSKQFSIGLDVGLRYSRSSQKSTTTNHIDDWGTTTRILLRAYF